MILKAQKFNLRNGSHLGLINSLNFKTTQCTFIEVNSFHANENNNMLLNIPALLKNNL